MRVAAIVAMSHHPYWRHCLTKLTEIADDIYVSYDKDQGDPEILHDIEDVCRGKLAALAIQTEPWSCPEWRERGLRMLDDVPDNELPDVVLTPDQDEEYGDGIEDDLKRLWYSEKDALEFLYEPLMASDGRDMPTYPVEPHVKAFKYKRGLSFYPYHRNGNVAQYFRNTMQARSKIKHYASYTPLMQDAKRMRTERKAVTLIGFGASAKNMDVVGEIWSLNSAYNVLNELAWSRCTRVFEMHQREKLEAREKRDGIPHLCNLSKAGEVRRIIMQKKHDDIVGSEAFPLHDVIASNPPQMDWFAGTPIYMIAMALHEGYNHIRVYGLDQLDYEHTLQRECWAAWVSYALGKGCVVDGALTYLEPYVKRYGYEYGPEMDDYQWALLSRGLPYEIRPKGESRIVSGDLCMEIGK